MGRSPLITIQRGSHHTARVGSWAIADSSPSLFGSGGLGCGTSAWIWLSVWLKAVVMDATGQALTPVLKVSTSDMDIDRLFDRACEGVAADELLPVVMEPTGMIWFPVAVFCQRRGIQVFVVNSQQVADLRRYYKKHAKSDRIDARVLAKLPGVSPEKLHPLRQVSKLWPANAAAKRRIA